MTLRRTRDFGDRALNVLLDDMIKAMGDGAKNGTTVVPAPAAAPVAEPVVAGVRAGITLADNTPTYLEYRMGINDSSSALLYRHVVGIDGTGGLVYAVGGTSPVRPLGVATRDSVPGRYLYVAGSGTVQVVLQIGVLPQRGDPCYVSASEPGRVTNTRPGTGARYLIGTFWGQAVDGVAPVVLFMGLTGATTI